MKPMGISFKIEYLGKINFIQQFRIYQVGICDEKAREAHAGVPLTI
jgi:hypothetical protein